MCRARGKHHPFRSTGRMFVLTATALVVGMGRVEQPQGWGVRSWYAGYFLPCALHLTVGCSGSVIDCLQQQDTPPSQSKGQSPSGVVVAKHDEERCKAKVGQAVHFRFGYTVVPSMMISHLKVSVNGEPIQNPELFAPETKPGYAEMAYVFRPKKPGEYQVAVAPVTSDGAHAPSSWVVAVSE